MPSTSSISATPAKGAAVVIGSGFGGLAAAIRTQAKGYAVTLLEMRDAPGGRAYVYRDQGFTYDAGPTIVTVPFVLDELAAVAGKKLADYIRLVPCDPFYRIYFPDWRTFNYQGKQKALEAEIAKFNPRTWRATGNSSPIRKKSTTARLPIWPPIHSIPFGKW